MGWKMLMFVAFVQLVCVSASVPQMSLVREWESVDVLVPGDGGQGISRRPLDQYYDDKYKTFMLDFWLLDVYKDRLFVGLNYETSAPFYLAYHNLSDTSKSLLLQPYPSWDAHVLDEYGDQQIHVMQALRTDRCHRLWVIDRVTHVDYCIIVFDLNTDRILRKHKFSHWIDNLFYMVVDDDDCENPYLYFSDGIQEGIWTYSWAEKTLWHHPGGTVTAMVIAPNKSDYSTVYFNKDDLSRVWYISTRYLREKTSNMLEFEHRREHDVYLNSAALDADSNVLFAKTLHKSIRAYPCWNRYEWCVPSGWHDIAVNTTHEVSHVILDKNGNLWALAYGLTADKTLDNLSIFSVAITSVNAELNKNDTTNTTKLNETATPATDPASSTTVQTDYDGINNSTTATTEDTTAGTPKSNITAKDPASSTTEQASGVDYDRIISNTTATIEETIASTPNSDVKTQANGGNKMNQFANILFNFTNNTFIFFNFTIN